MLEAAGDSRRLLRIVRLIQRLTAVNVLASAAVREASADERFLAGFGIVRIFGEATLMKTKSQAAILGTAFGINPFL